MYLALSVAILLWINFSDDGVPRYGRAYRIISRAAGPVVLGLAASACVSYDSYTSHCAR